MNNLKRIVECLDKKTGSFEGCYYIPEAWEYTTYDGYAIPEDRKGELNVNPYDFMVGLISKCILSKAQAGRNFLVPQGCSADGYSVDLKKSIIYSMFPRAFTAWDHYSKGEICSGTFLKAILYLPFLKDMGVDIVYLLPVFRYSSKHKKGEIGSPYAIKNVYRLDENLHDPLLGEYSEAVLETEFKAFVEACHILGMQVMVDFVFRTVSRDNDLMVEHPDWFYWIDLQHEAGFSAPVVEEIKNPMSLCDKALAGLYKSKGLKEYLSKFVYSPKDIDPEKWEKIVQIHKQTDENILDLIEAQYGITTVPGFSDVVNDTQPPWTDITYLKYYYDVHQKARKYIDESQPSYIMQDGVKLNLYCGDRENKELCDYITGVIPYYQDNFGIDGARIDMGHALSPGLNREIIVRAKEKNRHFILWSEEFDPEKSEIAREDGYHFISGYISAIYKNLEKPSFNKRLITDTLMKSVLPITAAMETPDTPRAALLYKDKRKIEQLVLMNCFLPNSIPFINNGMELMEVQPMNLGLDNTEEGRYVLEKSDSMYGKLAFFDNCCLHWTNSEREWMQRLLLKSFDIRLRFIDILSEKVNYVEQPELLKSRKITFICHFSKEARKGVFFLANRSFRERSRTKLSELLPEWINGSLYSLRLVYAGDSSGRGLNLEKSMLLEPSEVIIGSIE